MALRCILEIFLRVEPVYVDVADLTELGLCETIYGDVFLKFVTIAWLEGLAVREGTLLKLELRAVLEIVSFSLTVFHGLVAEVALYL